MLKKVEIIYSCSSRRKCNVGGFKISRQSVNYFIIKLNIILTAETYCFILLILSNESIYDGDIVRLIRNL